MDEVFESESQVFVLPKKYLRLAGVVLAGLVLFGYVGVSAYFAKTDMVPQEETKPLVPTVIAVEAAGAVVNPGVYEVDMNARVADLLALSGGLSQDADSAWVAKNINLSLVLEDAQKVYVPFVWEVAEQQSLQVPIQLAASSPPQSTSTSISSVTDKQATADKEIGINVNSASQSELESLDGIGKVYAQRIIANRPYTNLQELAEKADIPTATLDKNAAVITF